MTAKDVFIEAMRRTDARDHEGFLAMQAPDCEWQMPDGELHGREAVRRRMSVFWDGFSGEHHEIDRITEDGGTVYSEGRWLAVNTGPIVTPEGELPPTGRAVELKYAIILDVDVERGWANSVHLYFDQIGFLAQLGLVPEPAAAAAQ
jgi:hypothetical protein